ncbi:MAG: carbon-nitrogen hydrolase family protein [Planctomycetaceae bacterium]|nr:carbon-nitrogen hydrolase family protein [Planctomycetaceae bacterium]
MRERIKLAAVAVDSLPGETSQNLNQIESWVGRAAQAGAELVLFPELSLSGFLPNHPTGNHNDWLRAALRGAHQIAESIPGPSTDRLAQVAREHGVLVSVGLLEDAGNVLHNTQVVIGPDGLHGKWRKMHVPMFEMPFYNGGGPPSVIETPLGRLGVNICFDALMPESTRLLAVQGVEIVLFPFAADPPPVTPQSWQAWAEPALRSRCQENGVFGLACNYVGRVSFAGVDQAFPGGGLAVGPRGEILAEWSGAAGQPDMLLVEFAHDDLRAARSEPEYLFRFRRPELYGPLTETTGRS